MYTTIENIINPSLCSRAQQLRVQHVQSPPPLRLAAGAARPALPRHKNLHRKLTHQQQEQQQPQFEQRQQQFLRVLIRRRPSAAPEHASPPLAAPGLAQPFWRRGLAPPALAPAQPRSSSSSSAVLAAGAPLPHRSTRQRTIPPPRFKLGGGGGRRRRSGRPAAARQFSVAGGTRPLRLQRAVAGTQHAQPTPFSGTAAGFLLAAAEATRWYY